MCSILTHSVRHSQSNWGIGIDFFHDPKQTAEHSIVMCIIDEVNFMNMQFAAREFNISEVFLWHW
jgi:hypothetical protein